MMIHPATAHFAMVLPVVASAFGIAYMITETETMSKISARTALVAALAMIAVWYTGEKIAGPAVAEYLSAAGKAELLEHRDLGRYLAIAMALVALIQIAGCRMKKSGIQIVGIILTIGVMAVTFLQGKDGGEIVYEYGQPFKMERTQMYLKDAAVTAEETEDCDEKVEAYEDAIDNIASDSDEINQNVLGLSASEANEGDDE
ncbi:MAG: hypothetical protein FAF04_04110 [Epsilonproteobacteria bacterium]|nr:hypothetical protein [Campylobacterota bacterium]